jgi:uncharacterized protein YndB with AHSA1/START domain
MTKQAAVVHATFKLERTYPEPPSRVFSAFADQETRRRWFAEGEAWEVQEFTVDFRVGGRDRARYRFRPSAPEPVAGKETRNDTTYLDIVPDRRIVLAYSMAIGEAPFSASLATVEIAPEGDATRLTFTHQGAYFEGADGPERRQEGWRALLDALAKELGRAK